jgi:pterin-4a-carbinolamine dehydratase
MNEQWRERLRPLRLERRYEFRDYETLREFLDRAADLSDREGLFPDMGFGRDYVNITIHVGDGEESLGDDRYRFARQLDMLADETTH